MTTTGSDAPVHIAGIELPPEALAADAESGSLIDLDGFRTEFPGIDGAGQTIVILDTGIDVDHPFFGPDADTNGIADRIVYQQDFVNNDFDASDDNNHGSNVASIAAGTLASGGMAPGANIVVLKVLNASGGGTFAAVEQGLQWCVANASAYNIVSVNMSFADNANYNAPKTLYGCSDEIAALNAAGVVVVSAAGNRYGTTFLTPGVSYPAADPNSWAVMCAWDANNGGPFNWSSGAVDFTTGADRIASFSQRSTTEGDIVAPGAQITGANATGGTSTFAGTSQAAPHIAGVVALAQQLAQQELGRRLTPGELRALLRTSATNVFDGDDEDDNVANLNANLPRVDMQALGEAIAAVVPAPQDLVGIDFGNGGGSPTNWTPYNGGDGTLFNLLDESGHATPIDLAIDTANGGLWGYASASFPPGQLPSHDPSLGNLAGALYDNATDTFTFQGLQPGVGYSVYVFGGDWTADNQNVFVNGLGGIGFTQVFSANTLAVNSLAGSSTQGLEEYAVGVQADATGKISISISVNGGSGYIGLAGLAVQQMQLGEPNDAIPEAAELGIVGHGSVVQTYGQIGNGTYGGSTGDLDFYHFFADGHSPVTVNIDASVYDSTLDSYVTVYDSSGNIVATNDNDGFSVDSYLTFTTPSADDYYVLVRGSGGSNPTDPFTPGTGGGVGSTGGYYLSVNVLGVYENNDSIGQATDTGITNDGTAALSAYVGDGAYGSSSGDYDFYKFYAAAHAVVTLDVDAAVNGTGLDSVLHVYNSAGNLLFTNDDDDSTFDSYLQFTVANAGYYYAVVRGLNSGNPGDPFTPGTGGRVGSTGNYILNVDVDTGPYESNDSIGQAVSTGIVAAGSTTVSAYVGDGAYGTTSGDYDFYSFYAGANSTVTLDVDADVKGSNLDSVLNVYNSAGELLYWNNDDDSTLDSYLQFTAPASGYYYAVVRGFGSGETTDPFTPGTGGGAGSIGLYDLHVTVATDIHVTSVTANGFSTLTVNYTLDAGSAPFEIGAYRSGDALFDGADALLDTVSVTSAADLTAGSHSRSFTIGTGAGELSLLGINGVADLDADYSLLFVLDDLDAVPENDASPFNEDNTAAFRGVYHTSSATSPVMVFGTGSVDTVTVATAGTNTTVTYGSTFSYPASNVAAVRVRAAGGNDTVTAAGAAKMIVAFGGDGNDVLSGGNVSDWLGGAAGNDTITGANGNDTINGGDGNDSLTAGNGNDSITGGSGDDLYDFKSSASAEIDTVVEFSGGGTDTLIFASLAVNDGVTVDLGTATTTVATHLNRTVLLGLGSQAANWENAIGGAGNDTVTGNALANTLTGNAGNDTVSGGAGNDSLVGGMGDDLYAFGAAVGSETDTVRELGSQGIDTLSFTALSASDPVTASLATSGTTLATHTGRTVVASATGQAAQWENLIGGAGDDSLTGNTGANALTGNGGNDTLTGNAGNDTFTGGAGNDSLIGGAGDDLYTFGAAVGSETDTVKEVGSQGTDTLSFASLSASDPVTASLSSGTALATHTGRTIVASTAGQQANWENLIGGAGNDGLTGNAAANALTGNGGNDTLNGKSGSDILVGSAGDDNYVFATAIGTESDTVSEAPNEGIDTLTFSSLGAADPVTVNLSTGGTMLGSHTGRTLLAGTAGQAANWEKVTGGAGNDVLTGNALANTLTGGVGNDNLSGGAGNDVLVGSSGNDTLAGGTGNDSYTFGAAVGSEADTVTELSGEGNDTLNFSSLAAAVGVVVNLTTSDTTLATHTGRTVLAAIAGQAANWENVTGGAGNDLLTGNSLKNVLTGNGGNDTLIGSDGDDTLKGNDGDDSLVGGNGTDSVDGGNGSDTQTGGEIVSNVP